MTTELKHRFGGHGGIATEWEITAGDNFEVDVVKSLPRLDPIQVIIHSNDRASIFLPEGVSSALAGELTAAISSFDKDLARVVFRRCAKPTPKAVCLYVTREDGKVLAVSRKKDFNKPEEDWRFGLPGGKVDPGETPLIALIREVEEETGYIVYDAEWVFHSFCPGETDYVTDFYLGKIRGIEGTKEPVHIRWIDPKILLEGPFAYSIGRFFDHLTNYVHNI